MKTISRGSLGILILIGLFVPNGGQSPGATASVTIPIHVSSKKHGNSIDFSSKDVEIYDDGKVLKLLTLKKSDDPIAVALVVDMSGSTEAFHSLNRSGLRDLLAEVNKLASLSFEKNEYFLSLVNNDLVAFSPKAIDRRALAPALNQLGMIESRGNTRLYDAILGCVERLVEHRYERKILLLITDGQDNRSRSSLKDVRNAVRGANVSVFGIVPTGIYDTTSSITAIQGEVLFKELVDTTGGRIFRNHRGTELGWRENILGWGEKVHDQLNNTFYATVELSASPAKPKWRKLEIELTKDARKSFNNPVLRTRAGVLF